MFHQNIKSLLFLLCLVFFSVVNSSAQTKAQETETKEIYFQLTAIKVLDKDSIHGLVHGGAKLGIKKGMIGSVKGMYSKSIDRFDMELGFASVRVVNDSETLVLMRPIEKYAGQEDFEIKKGDFVVLKVEVPLLKYRSIFYELGALNIFFDDVYGKSFYHFSDLFYNDSKEIENNNLQKAVNDVVTIYDYLKDDEDPSFKVLREPLQKGRYIGKTVFEVMRDCTPRDIYSYLNYVKTYPKYYMGAQYKIGETFATWVQNGAFYSKSEIKDSVLLYAKNPAQLKKFLDKNKATIEAEDFVYKWAIDAVDEPDSVYEKSMLAVRTALTYLPNNNTWGTYYYTYVQRLTEKKEYKKALPLCDSSIYFFTKAINNNAVTLLLFEKSRCYFNLELYKECLVSLEKGYEFLNNPANNVRETTKKSRTIYYYRVKALCYHLLQDYKQAIENYSIAIKLYKSSGESYNLQSAISMQGYLAGIYKKQGELQKALEIYNEQLALYTKLNDRKNIGVALDNIAWVQFSLADYRKAIVNYSSAKEIYLSFDNYSDAGNAQSNIGQAYWNLGKYDSAIAAHEHAIEYGKIANNFSNLGYSWKKIGELYKATGEKNKAFSAYDSSSHYYTLAKDTVTLRALYSSYGDIYYNDKQYQKAYDTYTIWNNLNKAANNKTETVNSLYWLSAASFYFNNDTSKKYSLECLQLAKEIGDKNNEYYAYTNLGSLEYKAFSYDEGNKYFNAALKIAVEQKNKSLEAALYRTIGSSYSTMLDFDKALPLINKAIKIYDSLGDKSSLPNTYRVLGNAMEGKGDFYEARRQYQKSIDIAYSINSRADVGYGYSSLVFLCIIQGELAKAEQAVDSTYNIYKDLNNNFQMGIAYQNKGAVYQAKNDGVNAVKYYSMADSIFIQEKDAFSQSVCQTNIGCVYYYQADYDNALKYFYAADSLLNTIKLITEAHILSPINIGEVYYYKKDYAKAEPFLVKGYKMAVEKNAGRMKTIGSSFLGTLYYELKKYDVSEKYLLEGFALAEKSNEADLYINSGMYLGKLYTILNQPTKAEEYFRKTINFTKTIDNSKYTWMALYEYGLNQYNQNKMDTAIVYFKQAVEIIETGSQNLFGGAEAKKIYSADERKVDLYNKLVAALAKLNKTDEALYYANKGNVQAVKEKTESAGISTTDKEKEDAIKKGGELLQKKNAVSEAIAKEKAKPEKEQNKQLIASLESVKSVAESDYANYIDGLIKKYPDMQSYFSNTNPNDFRNYIEYIPDNTLVALYIVNDNQLFIFTVTSKETSIKTVPLNQDINKQAARLLSILRNPNNVTGTRSVTLRSSLKPTDDVRGDFKKEATELYNLLITPIAEDLKGKENLCVITNGRLGSIPFQSLGRLDEKNNFHFLMEDYAIFYTSKIDIFAKMYKSRKMESSLAIFGNPDKSLPGATIEAEEIAKIIPNATVYVEDKATESKAKESLQKYNYIHFATHGVLDYTDFNESYLLFAPDDNGMSDGKLTIKEINGLSKQTNSMVVLSACETAVSKEEVKGWYISPANAFLTNRVDAVLGSLWKVPDETTNLLLQEFYKNIEQKKMTKAEALRHAQATVSQKPEYSHPFYWSAFVLYGEWR
ncbi:MAG: CHAT domain-containing protein [Chitinophagaceae bacterium]|nr:CHAT domain-containing protein [Chitinophagaceae bacterium]MCW5905494.1 CHAT domain-containing protein [Chitinophagaceae bacterium]